MSKHVAHLSGKLTSRFPWTTTPLIVGAPMRVLAGAKLAVAISAAGGLGFIGPAAKTQQMEDDLKAARKLTQNTTKLSPNHDSELPKKTATLPVGVGFQLWSDDLGTAAQLIQQYRPCVVWLYAPNDEKKDYISWSSEIRHASPETAIWIQIGTIREVQQLLEMPKLPDAIVIQGSEAGGHGRAEDGMGLLTLFPEVADLVRERGHQIPLLAAGGIADGRGVAAALCLGAGGTAMGTRFLAASEARINRGYQQEIIRATDGGSNTTRTLLYNQLRGTVGWPKQYAPRTIINRSFIDHQNGVPFEKLKALHDDASTKGDLGWGPEGRLSTYAGASIGLIKDVSDASMIVQDTQRETEKILRRLGGARI